jgi:hypothetical protein
MKFNEQAFEQFEKAIGSNARFKRFMALAENSLVDSNMFIRCATLTYHKFLRAGYDFNKSKLLHYMSSKQVRARLVASLIQLITPETLNQVKMIARQYDKHLLGKCFLLEYVAGVHDHRQTDSKRTRLLFVRSFQKN